MRHSGGLKSLARRLAVVTTIAAMLVATAPARPAQARVPVPTSTATVSGQGFWAMIGCLACVSGFLIGGATAAAGVAAVLAANPEIAVACVATCANAL